MRSDRLMRAMHKVYGHDLPNQLVVLQSLLQMLQLEEADRLSDDGREYVRRLQNATQRTAQMVRFLKEMEKLGAYTGKIEELSLSMLAREIQGTLKQQFPHKQFAFDWRWDTPFIVGDYRTVLMALMEVLTWLVGMQANACQVSGTSLVQKNQTAVHFVLASIAAPGDNLHAPLPEHGPAFTPEQRMEVILARESLAVSQATLDLPTPAPVRTEFTILVPNR